MAIENDIYTKLSERVGVTGYPRYVKILEAELTPEEAKILVELVDGTPPGKLAEELNMSVETLHSKIADLRHKGALQLRPTGYALPQSPRFFYRRGDTPELLKLWHDFFHSGDYPEIHIHHIKERAKKTGGRRSHKVIPARQALLASPHLKKEDILWYEDMGQILARAKNRYQNGMREDGSLVVREGCGCRRYWGVCESPGGCTGWDWKEGEWPTDETIEFERARPTVHSQRKPISLESALAACDEMENFGQVHISPNTGQITSTCNCCECDCEILHGMKNFGNIYEMLSPSRFRAVIDEQKCRGCQTCLERCHFDAIEMKKVPGSKKMKAFIIGEHCMGCGLCIFKCPNQALRFELIRPAEHIPTIPMNVMFGGR